LSAQLAEPVAWGVRANTCDNRAGASTKGRQMEGGDKSSADDSDA
jgi:hypothetical protein